MGTSYYTGTERVTRAPLLSSSRRHVDIPLVALGAFMVSALVVTVIVGWETTVQQQDEWRLFDWLISYDAGFVRRGLFGTIVWELAAVTGIPAPGLVLMAQSSGYAVLMGAGFMLAHRMRPVPWQVWPLLFSPFLFVFQVLDPLGGYRKDVLILALIAAAGAWGLRDDTPRTVIVGLWAMVPIVLMHEGLAVLTPYLLAVAPSGRWSRRHLIHGAVAATALGAATLAAIMVPGTPGQVAALCETMRAGLASSGSLDSCASHSAVSSLSGSLGHAVTMSRYYLQNSGASALAVVGLCVAGLAPAVWLARRSVPAAPWRRIWVVTGSAWVSSLPLFVVAADWGRFLYLHAAATALVLLAAIARHADRSDIGRPRRWLTTVIAGATVAYGTTWNINHVTDLVGSGWL